MKWVICTDFLVCGHKRKLDPISQRSYLLVGVVEVEQVEQGNAMQTWERSRSSLPCLFVRVAKNTKQTIVLSGIWKNAISKMQSYLKCIFHLSQTDSKY